MGLSEEDRKEVTALLSGKGEQLKKKGAKKVATKKKTVKSVTKKNKNEKRKSIKDMTIKEMVEEYNMLGVWKKKVRFFANRAVAEARLNAARAEVGKRKKGAK